jgi:hypothetical protein
MMRNKLHVPSPNYPSTSRTPPHSVPIDADLVSPLVLDPTLPFLERDDDAKESSSNSPPPGMGGNGKASLRLASAGSSKAGVSGVTGSRSSSSSSLVASKEGVDGVEEARENEDEGEGEGMESSRGVGPPERTGIDASASRAVHSRERRSPQSSSPSRRPRPTMDSRGETEAIRGRTSASPVDALSASESHECRAAARRRGEASESRSRSRAPGWGSSQDRGRSRWTSEGEVMTMVEVVETEWERLRG